MSKIWYFKSNLRNYQTSHEPLKKDDFVEFEVGENFNPEDYQVLKYNNDYILTKKAPSDYHLYDTDLKKWIILDKDAEKLSESLILNYSLKFYEYYRTLIKKDHKELNKLYDIKKLISDTFYNNFFKRETELKKRFLADVKNMYAQELEKMIYDMNKESVIINYKNIFNYHQNNLKRYINNYE